MKLRHLLLSPLLLASCSDLTPQNQEEPITPAPRPESAAITPGPAPTPTPKLQPTPISQSTTSGPENPLGFLDPDTTDELMTNAKKKTVTSANANLAPPPTIEGDNSIEIDPPKLPEVKD